MDPVRALNIHPSQVNDRLTERDIVKWVNGRLATKYTKFEDFGNGAVYCQLVDMLFENVLRMTKVDFFAQFDQECRQNYKILQASFKKLRIDKDLPTNDLLKLDHSAHHKFSKWFIAFAEVNNTRLEYDPVMARGGIPTPGSGIPSESPLFKTTKIKRRQTFFKKSKSNPTSNDDKLMSAAAKIKLTIRRTASLKLGSQWRRTPREEESFG